MLKIYRNTAIFIIVIMIGVQWGFYRTYTSEFPNFINKTTTIHIHGILLMMWLVLLVVQPLLISTGRRQLHRTIGARALRPLNPDVIGDTGGDVRCSLRRAGSVRDVEVAAVGP